MGEFSIGRMASLNCVSEKALRLYQQKGLLEPLRIDDVTGYRYYSYEQCSTIDMIQQLQSLGVTLDEIKHLIDSRDISQLAALLEERLSAIEEELSRLTIAHENARHLLGNYRTIQDKPICDQVILEYIGERCMISFDIFNPRALQVSTDTETFLKEWEINLRLTKKHMRDKGIPLSLFHMVGCSIARDDLEARRYRLQSSFIFIDECALPLAGKTITVPPGKYLTLYKNRYTEPDGKNAEIHGLEEILTFAEEHGFEIAGDYLGEIVAETPAFLYEGREMLFELQIPVTIAR